MTGNSQGDSSVVPGSGMSLYVHVPFCKTKCPYCDFNTYQGIEILMGPYLNALTLELDLWGETLGHPLVNTVFFGGGTPSYLPPGQIQHILAKIASSYTVSDAAEITIEANPGDLDQRACEALLRQGVNRLSIGVQSLDNGLLSLLGRRHSADQALEAFGAARNAGFSNVNLDLMYGLPRQTYLQWVDTMGLMLSQMPSPHFSVLPNSGGGDTPPPVGRTGKVAHTRPRPRRRHVPPRRICPGECGLPPLRNLQLVPARTGEPPQHGLLAQPNLPWRWSWSPFQPVAAPFLGRLLSREVPGGSGAVGQGGGASGC